ncbi:MAG TPA: AraC family transcriptional regulator [Clostridia bacterium]|nr:AraC family transcriptional regulator [Clostridia bacterium]HOR12392.1 AraC family transcriptional regulator [Clostridia bacterium]HPY36596.1 AraC family transcriptional regulator [Clostridia bacterium]
MEYTQNSLNNDYKLILEHLSSTDISKAKMVFCEKITETSSIWNFNRHSHDFTEYIFILDGKMRIDVPGKKITKAQYDLIVYPKGVRHQEYVNMLERQQIICIGISAPCTIPLKTSYEMCDNNGVIRWLFEQIYLEHTKHALKGEEIIHTYIMAFFLHMQRYFADSESRQQNFIGRCTCYIHDHIKENISVEKLSKIAYVSPSHLARSFKKTLGVSPLQYIKACRIEIAKRLLVSTNTYIGDIAALAGFNDAKYFYRVFKAQTKMTPREYRNYYKT